MTMNTTRTLPGFFSGTAAVRMGMRGNVNTPSIRLL
jgi:hypothetical protein